MTQEQRSFFRLDVMLPCSYRILSPEQAKSAPLPTHADSGFIEKYFMHNLVELDKEINDLVDQIGTKSTILADALTAINNKISFIMQTIDQDKLTQCIPQRMVNLSAGGICFSINEKITQNDVIDVLLVPLKQEAPIIARCHIVKITNSGDSDIVSLKFDNLSEDDRRKLVYFIQTKEVEAANKLRHARD
ncbi:PilZ domain-containing protein [Thiomicrospira microaerophila]|uniref:PilZ domain-containing protein n=1 Tax=Thiomicrospira microaerophila TaxID=406020 RepID=UPI0020105410|nr:PilZ domain-containing protein [Thiomicrospira microaerophila]UQB42653.1 PilZ domain-containing protein [Thiomicrospira microaerophila]